MKTEYDQNFLSPSKKLLIDSKILLRQKLEEVVEKEVDDTTSLK